MGRVRRYKKIKACDPFARNHGSSRASANYDDPPELFESQRKKRKRGLDWDNEDDRERLLQQQAMRELKATHSTANQKKPKLDVEPIRAGETLKRFKKRVREEASKMLSEQVPRMTATAQRRKEKMKSLQLKKKKGVIVSSKKDKNEDDELVFGSRADGVIRPSDRGDSSEQFKQAERINLGETAENPPDLGLWREKLAQKAQKMTKKNTTAAAKQSSVEVEKIRLQAIEAYKQIKEKRRQGAGINTSLF